MLEMCVNQGAGLSRMGYQNAPCVIAMASHGKQQAYLDMQTKTHAQLERFAKNNPSNVLGGNKGPGEVRLTWQPSYVASRMNEHSESEDGENEGGNSKKKRGSANESACCYIS